jgi:hypothetical protein
VIAIVRSAIVMLYPRTEELPGAEDCDLDAFLTRYRDETTPLVWIGVVLGAVVFHLTPIVTVRVPLPATALSPKQQDRHAHAIASTDSYLLRQAIFLVKLVAGLAWGSNAEVRAKFALAPLPTDPDTWRSE